MSRSQPIRVLLVEDDSLDFAHVAALLDKMDSPTIEKRRAKTMGEALAILADPSFQPDVVITDLTLPDSKGLDSFRTIARHAGHLPILVLTGIENDTMALKAVAEGAQDYLRKRKTDQELLRYALRSALARHAAEQVLQTTADGATMGA